MNRTAESDLAAPESAADERSRQPAGDGFRWATTAAASAPGLGLTPATFVRGPGLTAATSAPGLGGACSRGCSPSCRDSQAVVEASKPNLDDGKVIGDVLELCKVTIGCCYSSERVDAASWQLRDSMFRVRNA